MAGLVLGAIGGYFFGPIGFAIGSMIGNLLFPGKGTEGPRLSNLKVQQSTYGQMIPIIYGTMRVGGNVTWQTDLIEHEHHSGGKGGAENTTYSYGASFMVQLCEGPIGGVSRVWADGTVIWNTDGSVGQGFPFTLYFGDEDQLPDPTMEAIEGVGNVPAYRGTAYIVADDWDVEKWGNRIPNLNFEVSQKGADGNLHVVRQNLDIADTYLDFTTIFRWDFTNVIQTGDTADDPSLTTAIGSQRNFDQALDLITPPTDLATAFPGRLWWGPTPHYRGIGIYKYSNGDTKPLWLTQNFDAFTSDSDVAPPIVTPTVTAEYDSGIYIPKDEAKFLHAAGIPDSLHVRGATLSGDGTKLFVFTNADEASTCDTWWLIEDGLNTDTGTISPRVSFDDITGQQGNASRNDALSVEDNGRWFWFYKGSDGIVSLYKISGMGGNMALVTGLGTLTLGTDTGGTSGSILAFQEGYAGLARGKGLWLLSRLGDAADNTTLAEIVLDLSVRAGLDPSEVDVAELTDVVDGYIIQNQQTCRDSISPLRSAYYFDAVESAGVAKFVKRGADAAAVIADIDLGAQVPGDTAPPLVSVRRAQEVDLPAILNVSYINAQNDYQIGTQLSQRQVVQSELTIGIQLGISMTDAKAKQIANTLLYTAWIERRNYTFALSRKYAYLEPTDVIEAHGYEIRILSKSDGAGGIIQFEGVASVTGVWEQVPLPVAPIGFTPSTPPTVPQATKLILFDIPMVTDADDQEGFRAGMAGAVSPAWAGGSLYQSTDGGTSFSAIASTGSRTIMGTVTALPVRVFASGNIFDENSIFQVTIGPGGGDLTSINELAVLNGGNMAVLGAEILQFKNATLIGAGVYELTGLLRGRRGTEWAISQHATGEVFALLSTTLDIDAQLSQLGQTLHYKSVTSGQPLAGAIDYPFVNTGNALRPYTPVQLGGGVLGDGDVRLSWRRRTRIGGAWNNLVEVPLSESDEVYIVQIWDATYTQCARIYIVQGIIIDAQPAGRYYSADMITDFGAAQKDVFFSVQQLGTYQISRLALGSVPGGGVSNTDPLAQVTPYGAPPGPPPDTGCTLPVIDTALAWANTTSTFTPLPTGYDWVLKLTTGSSALTGMGLITGTEFAGDPPTVRHASLGTSPCGTPLVGTKKDGTSFSIPFYMVDNPDPALYPTLDVDTDYYLSITTDADSSIIVELKLPT